MSGHQGAHLLVVDDEVLIREVAALILSEVGYHVLKARNGREALEVIEANPDIELVFTDVMMPEIDGIQMAQMAKEAHPHLRFLYTSAHVDKGEMRAGAMYGPLLPKPYSENQLKATIHAALN